MVWFLYGNGLRHERVQEKWHMWKRWKLGGSKQEYQLAKIAASRAVCEAKQQTQSEYFRDINTKNDRHRFLEQRRQLKIPIKM